MSFRSLLLLFGLISLFACSDSDCITCTSMNEELEFCEDSGIIYTDVNGEEIPYDELEAYWENLGFECD